VTVPVNVPAGEYYLCITQPENPAGCATVMVTDPPRQDKPAPLIDLADATVPCVGEIESNSFDYVEGKPGSGTIGEAVDGWTFEGGAPYLRAGLVSIVDPETGRAALIDGEGNLRILLNVRENENGWLVESSERCLDP